MKPRTEYFVLLPALLCHTLAASDMDVFGEEPLLFNGM